MTYDLAPKSNTPNRNRIGALHGRRLQAHQFIADALVDACGVLQLQGFPGVLMRLSAHNSDKMGFGFGVV